jgi:hypothetical protein
LAAQQVLAVVHQLMVVMAATVCLRLSLRLVAVAVVSTTQTVVTAVLAVAAADKKY